MKKKPGRLRQREPSATSLREIPEVDFTTARPRKNRYAQRVAAEGIVIQVGRGRPKKVMEVGGTVPRSVRFPARVWALLEQRAKKKGLTLHAALREAILDWLNRAA
jgi:hypothetical protein